MRFVIALFLFGTVVPYAATQTVAEAIRDAGRLGRAYADPVRVPPQVDRLEVRLRSGDRLTYDVTVEFRKFAGDRGYSIDRFATELTFTVEEERADGYLVSWPDIVLGDRTAMLTAGRVLLTKNGRFTIPDGPVSEVLSRFLVAFTLPLPSSPIRDEFSVEFRTKRDLNATALGKVFHIDEKDHRASIALYGRNVVTGTDWECHTVFDWRLGVVARSTSKDLSRNLTSHMEFKSLRHARQPVR